jgi:hypothetical protein
MPRLRLQQEQPPDTDQRAGGEEPREGTPRVGDGQLARERGGDLGGRTEHVDRRVGRLFRRAPVPGVVGDGLIEPIVEFGEDPRAGRRARPPREPRCRSGGRQ